MNFPFVKVQSEKDNEMGVQRVRKNVKLSTFVNKDLPYTITFTVQGAKQYLRVASKAGEKVTDPIAKYKLNAIIKTTSAIADLLQMEIDSVSRACESATIFRGKWFPVIPTPRGKTGSRSKSMAGSTGADKGGDDDEAGGHSDDHELTEESKRQKTQRHHERATKASAARWDNRSKEVHASAAMMMSFLKGKRAAVAKSLGNGSGSS